MPQNLPGQLTEFRSARQIRAITGQIDARQHDLGMATLDQRPDLIDHRAHRHRARIAAAKGNDAEGATMIAAVLHLHEYARQARLESFQQMRRHLAHRHDVGDRNLFARLKAKPGAVECRPRALPGLSPHLVAIADDAIDLCHAGEHFGLCLGGAAGDDDPGRGPFALEPADRLPRLCNGLVGDGATVDEDGVGETRAFGLDAHHLGLEGIETAAKGDDFDAHATEANSAGSKRPSYSKVAGPVIRT